jgi:RND family efflux transporter MFP subunit
LLGLATLAAAAGSVGCGGQAGEAKSEEPPSVPSVQTVRPARQTLHRLIEQPARVEAFEETPIFAKIPGYVERVHVEIGTRVRKDALLAKLRVPELAEELKEKEGLVDEARIAITQAESGLKVARANQETMKSLVEQAKAGRKRAAAGSLRWRSELKRMEVMTRDGSLDRQNLDETRLQLQAAEAAQEEADAKVRSAGAALDESAARCDKAAADLAAARSRLEVAQSERRRVAALLAYSEIRAPFDGVVADRQVHTGHFLQPSASGPTSKARPLFVVVRTERVRVFLDVPEADAVLVRTGAAARIRVPTLNDREFAGTIAGSSWSLDPAQRTLRTEIDFDNPGELLRPGMYAHAFLPVEQPDALSLPSAAVLVRDGQSFCFCVENGKAVRTPLRIGARHGNEVEVRKKLRRSGKAGERAAWVNLSGREAIIVSNPDQLADGQVVNAPDAPLAAGG